MDMMAGVGNEEDASNISKYSLDNIDLLISTAEDDFNKEKKTLFATHVWNGSLVLARKLLDYRNYIEGKAVVEFGAASGIPSITAGKLGARLVCASDYPSPSVMDNLKRNCERNDVNNVRAVGHIWGEDATELLALNNGDHYDIAVAAECLWRHECHGVLLQSILATLRPGGGKLFMTYSHHIPGLEAQDASFVAAAIASGFAVESREEVEAPHMWSEGKTSINYCFVLIRT